MSLHNSWEMANHGSDGTRSKTYHSQCWIAGTYNRQYKQYKNNPVRIGSNCRQMGISIMDNDAQQTIACRTLYWQRLVKGCCGCWSLHVTVDMTNLTFSTCSTHTHTKFTAFTQFCSEMPAWQIRRVTSTGWAIRSSGRSLRWRMQEMERVLKLVRQRKQRNQRKGIKFG